mmetsp:Transcript_37344/g.73230  ORF Transcript_37344/g.73230 Transcript_37344/m.73230 type:complete len:541 (-) Transcript_37344:11-1633(-)
MLNTVMWPCALPLKARLHRRQLCRPSVRVLRPFYFLEVDPLLHHLPQRTHLPEPLHVLHEQVQHEIDLLLRGKPSDAEPQRRVRELVAHPQRPQHVARLQRRGRARAAGRHGDVLEGHEERLPLDVREGVVEAAGVAVVGAPVLLHVGDAGLDAALEAGGEVRDPGEVVRHVRAGDLAGRAEAHAQGVGEGAGTQAAFLSPPREDGLEPDPRPSSDVQGPDPLGPVHFVSAEAHHIHFHLVDVDGHLSQHLRAVRVKEHLVLPAHLADRLYRLQRPDLVVHRHHRNEARLPGPDGRRELLQIHQPRGRLHRQVRHLEPLPLQRPARVQHALVLGLRGDHVPLLLPVETRHPLHGDVVALRRPAREHDLLRARADQRRHLRPRVFHRPLALPTVFVRAGVGVAEPTGHVGEHGVEDAGIHGGRGAVVEVRGAAVQAGAGDAEAGGHVGVVQQGGGQLGVRLVATVGLERVERLGRGRGRRGQGTRGRRRCRAWAEGGACHRLEDSPVEPGRRDHVVARVCRVINRNCDGHRECTLVGEMQH